MKYRTLLTRAFHQQLRWLSTTMRPSTMSQYRAVAGHFLSYLERRFAAVRRPDQLRRDPHLLGWMEELAQREPPLSARYRLQQLLCLRRLFDGMADLPHPPRPGLIRPDDLPRVDFRLPRPLSAEDDQRLQQALGADNDLLANALLLQRGTGLRIGELVDLPVDCLHHIGGEHWAIRVPLGKLHSERWVPTDQNLRQVVARISYLATLPPSRPDPQFLLPRRHRRLTLITDLRAKLKAAAQAAGCSAVPVPHQLRHTYATDMMRHGVSLPGIMTLLGHATPRMTMCYVQVTQADLRREYLRAQTQPRHFSPPLPVPPAAPSADPASVLEAFRAALHLLDCSRQSLGYPKPLDALRRRLLKFIAAAERAYRH
jgi:site-specific recombinase XerD